ncbi:MAG: 4-hydroxy-tetrahydrodipicolinate reductase [Ruminococcaceae bacterium]|nr:4-hydroxy-tetrahydrodipicolinate reductase [Oscillospiraceae bacterium]
MNILINGILGFMGKEVHKLCEASYRGSKFICGVDAFADGNESNVYAALEDVKNINEVDCIVDFSHHSASPALLAYAIEKSVPVVLATTGHTDEEINLIYEASKKIPVFYSANMSLGIALLVELAKKTAEAMPDAEIEIIEKHHNRKLDAPSGTALMIANALKEVRPDSYANNGRSGQGKRTKEEIGIHAIRMGNIVGEHEVIIGTENQTITLRHEAHSRALFAEGALAAAAFIIGKSAGLYDMKSLV